MDFRESLISLRKMKGWSQEELGYKLDVSRQTVSKWESGATTPEMEKLIKMSSLFGVTVDELLGVENRSDNTHVYRPERKFEYKSKKMIAGLPLVHINTGHGFRHAKGIIAIGNVATGVVSIGALSIGIISLGALSLGLVSLAAISFGLLAFGGISTGVLAAGVNTVLKVQVFTGAKLQVPGKNILEVNDSYFQPVFHPV